MEAGVATRNLDQRTKAEVRRHGIKAFFSNRINIALGSDEPSHIIEELLLVMDYVKLNKEQLIAIFDGQGPLSDFIDQHL